MEGHLRRCRSALRAHVRPSTLRAQGLPLLRHPRGPGRWHFAPAARGGFAWHLAFPEQALVPVPRTGS
jgi:hypothetical protein